MKRICISAALALLCASLLPSCGGGGDSKGDFYMSTQNFSTGSKKFYVLSNPSMSITGGRGEFTPSTRLSKEEIKNLFGADYVEDDGSLIGGTMVYCQGTMDTYSGRAAACDFVYFVSGSKARLIAYPQQTNDYDALVHFVGAITPEDIKFSGFSDGGSADDKNVDAPDVKRVLVITTAGSYFDIDFDMSSGVAQLKLCYSSAQTAPVDEEGNVGAFSDEGQGSIYAVRAYMVQPN